MHEYTVAYDIYATAKRAALENAATGVRKISADFGEMSMKESQLTVPISGISILMEISTFFLEHRV